MSGAREDILGAIERAPVTRTERVPYATLALHTNDLSAVFALKAREQQAEIVEIWRQESVPRIIGAKLEAARAVARVHLPANSPLRALPWTDELTIADTPPGREDATLSMADYAIAETGTLVFFSAPERPASWHFLPGREFVILSRAQILPTLEDVLALATAQGLPSTLNLVTGPSRTGDIEQTLEIGAHGPRQVCILLSD